MIKVNLLRNNSAASSKTTATEINYDTAFDTKADGGVASSPAGMLLKFLLMFMGAAGLMMYESYNIGELRTALQQAQAASTALSQELTEKKPMVAKARELQKQIQDLESRIQAIKDLSKVRLREIKAIDYLQNIIPEKVWFSLLEFDKGAVKVEGGTTSDDELNLFLEEMERKSIFSNVILLRAVEQKVKEGTIKVFNISATLSGVE
jgi:Tfp pilus assembly protein PilN